MYYIKIITNTKKQFNLIFFLGEGGGGEFRFEYLLLYSLIPRFQIQLDKTGFGSRASAAYKPQF